MVLNDLNRSNKYWGIWVFPINLSWGGHGIDLTLGHRYKQNPRYTNFRYLVVYQILKVSNLSLHYCGRDAIGKFSEVGSLDLTWWHGFGWPGPTIFRKVSEQLSEQLCKKKRWRCTVWLKHITGSKTNVSLFQSNTEESVTRMRNHDVSKHRYYFLRWLKVTPSNNIWGLLWYINTKFFIGDWMLWRNSKDVATKFWLGGGVGCRIHSHPNPPTPKI